MINKRTNGEFQFNLHAANGQVILTSEGYSQKNSCQHGIESVRKNAVMDKMYERKTAANGKQFFNLKSSNGQVIGSSEMYEASSGVENGISSVKENAPSAPVVDQSTA